MSLQKLTFAVTLIALIVMTSVPSYVKADQQELLKNGSFEDIDLSVCEARNWASNNGGWRALRSDVNEDGIVSGGDMILIGNALFSEPGDPNYNPNADLNGDHYINAADMIICGNDLWKEMGVDAFCLNGNHSWYTSGGGDYLMWQWLDSDAVMALAGETVKFSFSFYPESVAPDGSQNNARAEIYYEYSGGSNTVYGVWVGPTGLNWWNAYVIANLPSTVYLVAVIIHGTPDFKAWVDLAQLTTSGYNLYYTYPPYDTLDTYPENGHCIEWFNAKVCVYANKSTGQASAYSWDATDIGVGKEAFVEFNMDPPVGNSPGAYEEDAFSVGAYWVAYGYLGPSLPSYSEARISLYLYKWTYVYPYWRWEHVKTYSWPICSIDYPNQEVYYSGAVRQSISSPPSGSGYYSVAVRVNTYAVNYDGSAVADFFYAPHYMWVGYIKMSD